MHRVESAHLSHFTRPQRLQPKTRRGRKLTKAPAWHVKLGGIAAAQGNLKKAARAADAAAKAGGRKGDESCSNPPAHDRRITSHLNILIQIWDLLQTRHGASARKGERKGISSV